MNWEDQEKFQSYMNSQLKILKGHHERIMLRILNKYMKLNLKGELNEK